MRLLAILPSLGFALVPAHALAAPDGTADASVSVDAPAAEGNADAAATPPQDRGDQPWIRRWGPERNMVEVGVFGGIFLPHPRLELFQASLELEDQGYKPFKDLSAEVGGRLAYYPIRFLGVELEGAVMPNEVDPGEQATLFALRGHLVANLIPRSITPFLLAGAGGMGVASRRSAVGTDLDAAGHFGGGIKFFLDRQTTLRLEARDNITARRGLQSGVVHSVDILFGVSLALGRKKAEPAPPPVLDTDGDGVLDPDDKCVEQPGVEAYDGCPIPDTDGDGILDPDDQCIDQPGVLDYAGCPIPDTDGDGILDPDDKCIDVVGVDAYYGCPIPDTDGDGILDPDDKCIDEPETKNGFEDDDGCPDEIPAELEKFTGVIEGIFFDTGKATIKKKSIPKLDNAVEVLKKFPQVRMELSGHTDDRGGDDSNLELSQRRADAVKQYFIDHGIGADRLETRGAGETEPRESNKTSKGRSQNRRIEFKVLE